jgi:hypothetical protein
VTQKFGEMAANDRVAHSSLGAMKLFCEKNGKNYFRILNSSHNHFSDLANFLAKL